MATLVRASLRVLVALALLLDVHTLLCTRCGSSVRGQLGTRAALGVVPRSPRSSGAVLHLVAVPEQRKDWARVRAVVGSVGRVAAVPVGSIALALVLKLFLRQWLRVNAGAKLMGPRGWVFFTIPALSGLVNWFTNKIAVWMIFAPQEYVGFDLVPRRDGSPMGVFGWQGIVPTKVKSMGGAITKTLLGLIDMKVILARLSSDTLADLLVPLLLPVTDLKLRELLPAAGISPMVYDFGAVQMGLLKNRLRACLARVILKLQATPDDYLDLQSSIMGDLISDKSLIVDLFKTCGRDELKFVVSTGLWGGGVLGLVQMLAWLVFPRSWTLAAGGALVGYVTNLFALKILFEPVDPVPINFGMFRYNLQGLFLQRQQEVSAEFAKFVCASLLTPAKLWTSLATGSRSSAMAALIKAELKVELFLLFSNLSEDDWDSLAGDLLKEIPQCARSTHAYVHDQLHLEETIRDAMLKMPPAQFEAVLHPIFQSDEATLIAVGTVLGAAAGFAQVPFY